MAAPINCIAQHIVLDLETLSTAPNAAVISIGAVALDGYGTCVSEFHVAIDGHGQPGRDIDAETLAWWTNQSPEAQATSLHATNYVSATHAMCQFSGWVNTHADPDTVKVWGNGSSFDCTILASLYTQCHELGHPPPWRYWNDRDMRTILDDFPEAKQVGDFVGIKHHALHDARHEAKQLAKALELRRMAAAVAPPRAYEVVNESARFWTVVKTGELAHNLADEQARAGWPGAEITPLYPAAPVTQVAPAAVAGPSESNLRKALQFYANGEHFFKHEPSAWDTISGEPPNFWEDEAGTATVEDGSIAKLALNGREIRFEDEDDSPAAPQTPTATPEGFVPAHAYDRLQALAESQAARILALEDVAPQEDADLARTIDQRDTAEGWADGLAELIGKYFGQDIGEHSSSHNPWQEAREIIEEAMPYNPAPVAQGDERVPGLIAAAEYIDGLASGYIQEHASTEPDTGAVVFDRHDVGADYYNTLVELADDLRGLAARAQAKEGEAA